MSIKGKYKIIPIPKELTYEWILRKHYAKRIPSISYSYGLYDNYNLEGILTIGKPASPSLCEGICGKDYSPYVYELNRLCVNDNLEKNTLSFFVSSSIKQIKDNIILVSYADSFYNHIGYIYQATNWHYTGKTRERTDIGSEDNRHSRHYDKNIDYKLNRKFRSSKYRYVYFIGKMKKQFIEQLRYNILPYPKGDNKRYDSSYQPQNQEVLFL